MVYKTNINQISNQASNIDHSKINKSDQIQTQIQDSTKQRNQKALLKYVKLIFTVTFHYSDFITDILLILYIYQLIQEADSKDQSNLANILLVLVFGITYNRFQLYNLCLQIQYYLKKLDLKFMNKVQESSIQPLKINNNKIPTNNNSINNNNNTNTNQINNTISGSNILSSNNLQHFKVIQVNNTERIKIALQVLFFVEQINFFLLERKQIKQNRKKSKTIHFLQEKEVSDLYIENYFSFTIGLCITWLYTYENKSPGWVAISSTFLSLISVISIQAKLYKKRIQSSYKYNELDFQDFEQFPPDLQLYLAYPGQIHLFKFHVNIKRHEYNHFFRKDIFQKQNDSKPNVSFLKQLLIFLYVLIYCVSATLVSTIQNITSNMMNITFILIIGELISVSYQYKYWKLYKQQNKSISCKMVLKEILKQPLYMLIGTLQFLFPMMTHEIPFIPETKQTWIYNYAPPYIQILIIQISQIYQLYVTLDVVYTKKNSEIYFIDTEEKLDNITNPDKIFRKCVYVTIVFFVLNLICTILYFSDKLFQKYSKETQKTEKTGKILNNSTNIEKIDEEQQSNIEQKQQKQIQLQQEQKPAKIGSNQKSTQLEGQLSSIKTEYQLKTKDNIYSNNIQSQVIDEYSTNRLLKDKKPVIQIQSEYFSFSQNDSLNWESQLPSNRQERRSKLNEKNSDIQEKKYTELNLSKLNSERQSIIQKDKHQDQDQ